MPQIEESGARLIALSPMVSKYTPQLVNKLGLTFPVLSDFRSEILEQLGVVYELEESMVEIYKGFGIDLDRFNGEDRWRLPLPGRIILDTNGVVKNIELSTDHADRPEPTETLEILRAL